MSDYQREYLFGEIEILRAKQEPCIVCGHPTGNCSAPHSEPTHIIGPGIYKSTDEKLTHLVEEDVFEEKQLNPFYKARIIAAHKGQKISLERARELGLL